MSQTAIPVTEAAKDFLRVIEEVERKRQPAVLTREGRPVATLNPVPSVARTCAELASRWREMDRLPADEASSFADDLELGRATLPPFKLLSWAQFLASGNSWTAKYAKYAKEPDHSPESRWGFAYFAYFAVPSLFFVHMVFESPHFFRSCS